MELLVTIIFIGFIYLLAVVKKMEKEIAELRRHTMSAQSPTLPVSHAAVQPVVPFTRSTPSVHPSHTMIPPEQSSKMMSSSMETTPSFDLIAWLTRDFLVKLGAFFLLIGVGWSLNFAIANGWIGPLGRITLGLLVGVGLMLLGVWRVVSVRSQGLIFSVLGSSVFVLTLFAARELYFFFTPVTALTLMFLSTVLVAKLAVMYKSEATAVLAFFIASIAPLMINNADASALSLFSYITVVVLSTLWIIMRMESPILLFLAVFMVTGYTGMFEGTSELLIFGPLFSVVFFAANLILFARAKEDSVSLLHGFIMFGALVQLWSWVSYLSVDWQVALSIAWSLIYAAGAYYCTLHTDRKAAFYAYGAISLSLLAVATSLLLTGPVLLLAFFVEVTALLYAITTLGGSYTVARTLSFLYTPLALTSVGYFADYSWQTGVIHDASAVITLTIAFLVSGAWELKVLAQKHGVPDTTGPIWSMSAILFGLGLIWNVCGSLLAGDTGVAVSLIIYTVIALASISYGAEHSHQHVRTFGKLLLGGVVARVLLIDVWEMELLTRVVTFLGLGVMLLATAFIRKFNK